MSVKCRVIKGGMCEITQGYGINGSNPILLQPWQGYNSK